MAFVNYSLPREVILDCWQCCLPWVQSVAEVLAAPDTIARCPLCREPYVLPEYRRCDAPAIVDPPL